MHLFYFVQCERSAIGTAALFGLVCQVIGFTRLPVGDAAAIIFSSPIYVMLFSHVILRDHCGLFKFLVTCFLMSGIILIAMPTFLMKILKNNHEESTQNMDTMGFIAAFAGSLIIAAGMMCSKQLLKQHNTHFSVIVFAESVIPVVLSALAVPLVSTYEIPNTSEEWICAFLVGILQFLGQCTMILPLRYGIEAGDRSDLDTLSLDLKLLE